VFTNPLGINERGEIVGRFCTQVPCRPEGPNVHGFFLSEGEFTTIDVPGAMGTNAWKINQRGDVVGGYSAADGSRHVFLLDMRSGHITTVDIPGRPNVAMENGAINALGDIVGFYCDSAPCLGPSLDAHGFAMLGGQVTALDVPGAIATNAFGINERGDIVGVYQDAAGMRGFRFSRGR
jgi:uncharacterized membrane protein